MRTPEAKKFIRHGAWFQGTMAGLWFLRVYLYKSEAQEGLVWRFTTFDGILDNFGLAVMVVAMLRIYWNHSRGSKSLITTDMFALTRHPMYHGMFICDLARFFSGHLDEPFFWISWVAFTVLLLIAGWFQEKETLAIWGEDARRYYAKTPRFILEWLWRRR
jgi:protein-S-isoprenylcysteine O-methyltransferase Ste14